MGGNPLVQRRRWRRFSAPYANRLRRSQHLLSSLWGEAEVTRSIYVTSEEEDASEDEDAFSTGREKEQPIQTSGWRLAVGGGAFTSELRRQVSAAAKSKRDH